MSDVRAYDWIAHHAVRYADKIAARDLHTDRAFTYRELNLRVGCLATHLREVFGVGDGDRVAMLCYNSTDIYEIQFACRRIGAVFLPLNWRLALPELEFIVNDASPVVLIHDSELGEAGAALEERTPIRARLVRGGTEDSPYERALADAAPFPGDARQTLSDTAAIMYTSGTTGRPKGAILTHRMTFYNAVNLGGPAKVGPDSVFLCVLPLFHTGGLNCYSNVVFHCGGTNVVLRSFDPAECLRHMANPEITHFFGVPAMYQAMSQLPEFESVDLSHLVNCGVGAAPCPIHMLETWEAKGVSLQQGYGLTETSPTVLVLESHEARNRIGSAGLPALHTEVRLVDPEGHDIKEPGQVGEIWVRGPNVSPGYFNRPEATEAGYVDGWLKTGDAATRDADGYYTIVDRWKDMYISGGENVYPVEVENVIYQLDAVAEVAVIGVPHEKWGEVGEAVVVLREGAELTPDALIEHCRGQLARYKVPKSVRFIDALPRNATGKILKRELRAQGEQNG